MSLSVLILTNSAALGLAIRHATRLAFGDDTTLVSMTYQESTIFLTPQRIKECDFLVLDLFRDYPGGTRAEGIALAKRWMQHAPFLIVSPLYLSEDIDCPGYWDVSARDSLVERMKQIVASPHLCRTNFDRLAQQFHTCMELPPQH